MGYRSRFFNYDPCLGAIPQNVDHSLLRAGGADGAVYGPLPPDRGRVSVIGCGAQGVLAAAGRIALQIRRAPIGDEGGGTPYQVGHANEDDKLVTPYKDWENVCEFRQLAAGEFGYTPLWPSGSSSLVTRVTDGSVPVIRAVDLNGAFAAQTFTFGTPPGDGDTITINGKTGTYRVAPALADEILIGATAAACAVNTAAWINSGPGEGQLYFSSTFDRTSASGYATVAGAVLTFTAYPMGTTPNAWGTTETGTAITAGGATMAGGAAGSLANAATDYLELVLEHLRIIDPMPPAGLK